MSDTAMKYEDWLRGCVHHDGRKGNVYLPCDTVLEIADWIEAHRDVAPDAINDNVNHPSHYETGKFECFDVMRECFGDNAVLAFCLCNAFKYLYRCSRKNGMEDIEKAKWYIDRYLEIRGEEG